MWFVFFLPWVCFVPFRTSNHFVINSMFLTSCCVKQCILLVAFCYESAQLILSKHVLSKQNLTAASVFKSCLIWAKWFISYTVSFRYCTPIPFKSKLQWATPPTKCQTMNWSTGPHHLTVSLTPDISVAHISWHYLFQ